LTGKMSGPIVRTFPVQRPLARRWVLLSHQVFAYYGLICASRSLPPLYVLCGGPLPFGLLWAGSERGPHLLCLSVPFVPSSVPRWTGWLHLLVASPPRWPSPSLHRFGIHIATPYAGSCVVCVTRLQSSLNATAR